jgi:hypothetical protein
MGYYLAVKRNGVLIHATTWMNLENMMLGGRSQTKRANNYLYDCIHLKCPQWANP